MNTFRFTVTETPLDGLKVVQRHPKKDNRGFLCRMFCQNELETAGWQNNIAQVNHTWTVGKGSIRGMHYQLPPHAEVKLVSCLRGAILDVAVDVRAGSPTFLKWYAVELSEDNFSSLLIPEGFAHGFQTLTDDVQMIYLHSVAYNNEYEAGLNPLDQSLAIDWQLPPLNISERDSAHPLINAGFKGVQT